MKLRSISSVVALSVLLSACGSNSNNDMTARQATAVLNEYFGRNPETSKVLTGMNNIAPESLADHWATPDGKYQKAMEAAGLVTITPPQGKIYNPANHNQWMYALDIKLTERGKRMVRGKPLVIPAPSKNTWDTVYENAVFCNKMVLKIVSISTAGDTATADYKFENGGFTPFYDAFHLADPTNTQICPTQPQQGTASFERQNGVWGIAIQ